MADHLLLDVRRTSRAAFVMMSGELDVAGVPELREVLAELSVEDRPIIAVELAHLEFIDSAGLSVLVSAHKRAVEQGCEFLLLYPSTATQTALKVSGLVNVLTVVGAGCPEARTGTMKKSVKVSLSGSG